MPIIGTVSTNSALFSNPPGLTGVVSTAIIAVKNDIGKLIAVMVV
jgi:hypothetical protein